MPAIGSITVTVWKGTLTSSVFGYQLYEQGGADGYGVTFGGRKVGVQTITTVTRPAGNGSTLSDYNAAQAAYRALMRTSVYVTDQFGLGWTGVIVMGVTPQPSYDALGYIITANWQLLVQSV